MTEPMTARIEIWPVAADKFGLWLLSGNGPWTPALAMSADCDVHAEVELELHMNSIDLADVILLHSTSWRHEGTSVVLTYIAGIRKPGPVIQNWPGAEPIDHTLPGAVGKPLAHGAAEPPTPRHVDVMIHALRHIAFLRDTDSTAAAVLDEHWRRHLDALQPALAGLYNTDEAKVVDHRRRAA